MEDIPIIGPTLQFYETLWAEQIVQFADFGIVYAWLAVASLVVAILGLIFTLLRRADGIQSAGLIGQQIFIYAAPYLLGALVGSAA